MLISCIIPTYNRPEKLANAVHSVLEQEVTDAEVEVIVANDSGKPLPEAEWQQNPRVRVITTYHNERCVSRNTGAAVSRGEYLHFLDDDDIILPGAYQALLTAARESGPCWTHGAFEIVNDAGEILDTLVLPWRGNIFAPVLSGPTVPLQTSLIERKAFFSAGGFDPVFIIYEDREIEHRLALEGTAAVTTHTVARIRAGVESSSGRWDLMDEYGRIAREKIFADTRCLSMFRKSMSDSGDPGVRGAVARYYLGSASRHVNGGAPLTGISRLFVGLSISIPGAVSPAFWQGLLRGR